MPHSSNWIALQPSRSDEHAWKLSMSQCRANLPTYLPRCCPPRSITISLLSLSPPLQPRLPHVVYTQTRKLLVCFCDPGDDPIMAEDHFSQGNPEAITLLAIDARDVALASGPLYPPQPFRQPRSLIVWVADRGWIAAPNETPKALLAPPLPFFSPCCGFLAYTWSVLPLPIEYIDVQQFSRCPITNAGDRRSGSILGKMGRLKAILQDIASRASSH